MNYSSYRELCADPATQSEFLEFLSRELAAIDKDWQRTKFLQGLSIGGKPFSTSQYLTTLDMVSADWDMDEDDPQVHRFVAAAKTVALVHPDLNVPRFVLGFENLPGSNLALRVGDSPREHTVSTAILGGPGFGRSVLSTERVTVTVPTLGSRRATPQ